MILTRPALLSIHASYALSVCEQRRLLHRTLSVFRIVCDRSVCSLTSLTLTFFALVRICSANHEASEHLALEQISVSEGGVSTPGGCQVHEPDRGLLSSRSVGIHAASERLVFEQTSVSEGGATAPGGCQTFESRQRSAFEQDRWASFTPFGLDFGWSGLSCGFGGDGVRNM